MVVSQRPQNIIVLIIGTPKMVPLVYLGNPHIILPYSLPGTSKLRDGHRKPQILNPYNGGLKLRIRD